MTSIQLSTKSSLSEMNTQNSTNTQMLLTALQTQQGLMQKMLSQMQTMQQKIETQSQEIHELKQVVQTQETTLKEMKTQQKPIEKQQMATSIAQIREREAFLSNASTSSKDCGQADEIPAPSKIEWTI